MKPSRVVIQIRVSASEKRQIQRAAKRQWQFRSMSSWLRALALKAARADK